MHLTDRQKTLLKQLDHVVYRRKASGTQGYFLAKDDCTSTINSLIVKGLIRTSDDHKRLHWTGLMPRDA